MGGGDSGSNVGVTGTPTSGGMTVYNGLGYDPSQPQGGGLNWGSLIGGGLQSFGKGMGAGGSTPPSAGGSTSPTDPLYIQQQQPSPPIPQNNIVDALMRILSGG